MGGASFYNPIPLSPSAPAPDLVQQIAERVSAMLSADLERIEQRIGAIEELAQRST